MAYGGESLFWLSAPKAEPITLEEAWTKAGRCSRMSTGQSHFQMQAWSRGSKLEVGWGHTLPMLMPRDAFSPGRLSHLPRQHHKLGAKCWDTRASGGSFSFKPQHSTSLPPDICPREIQLSTDIHLRRRHICRSMTHNYSKWKQLKRLSNPGRWTRCRVPSNGKLLSNVK